MPNPKHLAHLKRGVAAWNEWRAANTESDLDLREANLPRANLDGADLSGANLATANLRGAHLNGAILIEANLNGADLREADLGGARLRMLNLSGANLATANLRGAHLYGATLIEANLNGANLTGANLSGADLSGAQLNEAYLSRANLSGADLSKATLTGAYLGETIFANCSLDSAAGLDTCRHLSASTIEHRTLTKSGPLPLAFLRGCGLPDRLIDYLPSLLNQAVQFYSCFISYSTKDQSFADRLHADLQNKGVRCWFAPHDIQGGKKIHEQIDEAIRVYDRLLLILSAHSMNSEWVKTEIAKARKRERLENRRMLFPIRLVDFATLRDWECFDGDTGKDSAREIREYFIPDFSEWKTNHDHYETALKSVLKDLQSDR